MSDKCDKCGGVIMWITYPGYGSCVDCGQGYEDCETLVRNVMG